MLHLDSAVAGTVVKTDVDRRPRSFWGFMLPGDDGVRDETSGRSGGVTTQGRLVQVFLERC